MAIPWKLYFTCWFLGASVQSAVFFSFNAVDYFNYFFPDDYKPEVYVGVTVGLGATAGAVLTVVFQPRRTHLRVLLITQAVSAVLLVAEVLIAPLEEATVSTPVRFGVVLAVIFLATVVQNVGGGALYSFAGKYFPTFGIHAAQSGGVCAFAATFVIRCVSKASFEHLKDRRKGFRLSGYLFVALVDLIIIVACCLIFVLREHSRNEYERRLNAVDHEVIEGRESTPLLRSDDSCVFVTRRDVIRTNWAPFLTIALTLVITNALFPGIASQFHGDNNCDSSAHNSTGYSANYFYADRNATISEGFTTIPEGITTITERITATPEGTTSTPNAITTTPKGNTSTTTTKARHYSDKTGWFIVILFGCFSVADAIGKNLPILGIIYRKTTVLCNCLLQLAVAIPILMIYFKPCVSGLQADWVAYFTLGLFGLINGYGICAAMMLLAPGVPGRKQEEGLATSIGYMFLQVGILLGMGISIFLVDYIFEITKN